MREYRVRKFKPGSDRIEVEPMPERLERVSRTTRLVAVLELSTQVAGVVESIQDMLRHAGLAGVEVYACVHGDLSHLEYVLTFIGTMKKTIVETSDIWKVFQELVAREYRGDRLVVQCLVLANHPAMCIDTGEQVCPV